MRVGRRRLLEREREKHGHPVSLRTRQTYRQDGRHVLEVAVVCEVLVAPPVSLYHSLEPVTLQESVTQCYTMLDNAALTYHLLPSFVAISIAAHS